MQSLSFEAYITIVTYIKRGHGYDVTKDSDFTAALLRDTDFCVTMSGFYTDAVNWPDTQDRDDIDDHVSYFLLARPWPTFGDEVDMELFSEELDAAAVNRGWK